jgi:hypothetical protein
MTTFPELDATRSAADLSDDQWCADRLFGTPTTRLPVPELLDATADDDAGTDAATETADGERVAQPAIAATGFGATRIAALLAVGLVLAIVFIVTALSRANGHAPAAGAVAVTPVPAGPAPAAPSTPDPGDRDHPLTYTASANCPAGSSAATALAGTGAAWVCVRGVPGARVDGQVLHIDFGRSYRLAAVSVIPGAVGKTPQDEGDWAQHRVITRLQYLFDDDGHTVVTQDTGAVHGPVTTALPHPLVASRVTVIVLGTARPTSAPPAADTAAPPPDLADSPLSGPDPAAVGPPGVADPGGDPVDATVALSALTFYGHEPQ